MGGGNAQKSATARARNEAKKAKAAKGSQLAVNQAACSIVCQVKTVLFPGVIRRWYAKATCITGPVKIITPLYTSYSWPISST